MIKFRLNLYFFIIIFVICTTYLYLFNSFYTDVEFRSLNSPLLKDWSIYENVINTLTASDVQKYIRDIQPNFYSQSHNKSIGNFYNVLLDINTNDININDYDVIIVGAGLTGAVIANLHASVLHSKVLVIDKRKHIGGNCFDYIDEDNILTSKYGAHIFHTKLKHVWDYANLFTDFIKYEHKVLASVDEKIVPIPITIDTINALFHAKIHSIDDFRQWLSSKMENVNGTITNGEQLIVSKVGRELFEKFFYNYTMKQWAKTPSEMDKDVLGRVGTRNNWDDRYFADLYQGVPKYGYSKMISRMFDNSLIRVVLNFDYFSHKSLFDKKLVFFTGEIDKFYNYKFGHLEYRSLDFLRIKLDKFYFQPESVVNYPQGDVKFTRIVEYKHFPYQPFYIDKKIWSNFPKTSIFLEFSKSSGDPYYPVISKSNQEMFQKYSLESTKSSNVVFCGRLGKYKYMNMDIAIDDAIKTFATHYLLDTQSMIESLTKSSSKKQMNIENNKMHLHIIIVHCKKTEYKEVLQQIHFTYSKYFDISVTIYVKCGNKDDPISYFHKYRNLFHSIQITEMPNVANSQGIYHFMTNERNLFGDFNLFMLDHIHGSKDIFNECTASKMAIIANESRSLMYTNHYYDVDFRFDYDHYYSLGEFTNWFSFYNHSLLHNTWRHIYIQKNLNEILSDFNIIKYPDIDGVKYPCCLQFGLSSALLNRIKARFTTLLISYSNYNIYDIYMNTSFISKGDIEERILYSLFTGHLYASTGVYSAFSIKHNITTCI